jgi:hypothetical protein
MTYQSAEEAPLARTEALEAELRAPRFEPSS